MNNTWTTYIVALIMSLPGYLTIWIAYRAATKLEAVHALVNSQSEKLNAAIHGEAIAIGELKGRADAVAEQQAAIAVTTPQALPITVTIKESK